jgi:hypothetical protein
MSCAISGRLVKQSSMTVKLLSLEYRPGSEYSHDDGVARVQCSTQSESQAIRAPYAQQGCPVV